MSYRRITRDEFQVHQCIGGIWEEVCCANTRREARADAAAYRANQPGDYRLIKKRVRVAPAVTTSQTERAV